MQSMYLTCWSQIKSPLQGSWEEFWCLHGLSGILGRELQVDQSVAFEGTQHATHCTTPTTKGEEPMCKIDGTKFHRIDDCSDSTTYWSCIPGINGRQRHIM